MRRLVVWVIAGLVAAVGRPGIAATENSTPLLLYSNGRLLPGNVEADRGLHQTVRAPADRPLMLFYEFLDAPRFGGEAYEDLVAAYLRGKFASRPPRVVIAAQSSLRRSRLSMPVLTGACCARCRRSPPT